MSQNRAWLWEEPGSPKTADLKSRGRDFDIAQTALLLLLREKDGALRPDLAALDTGIA